MTSIIQVSSAYCIMNTQCTFNSCDLFLPIAGNVLRCFSHFRGLWTFPRWWERGHWMLTIWMVCDGYELPSCSHDTGYMHTGPNDCPLRHFIDPAVTDLNTPHWYWDDFCQNRGQRLEISQRISIERPWPKLTIYKKVW